MTPKEPAQGKKTKKDLEDVPDWFPRQGGLRDMGSLSREDFQDSYVKSGSYFVPKRPVTRDANHLVRCKWEQTYHL